MRNIRPPGSRGGRYARASIALALTLLGAGTALSCSGDAAGPGDPPAEPPPGVTLTTLEITPTIADLCVPGHEVQLTIVPRDRTGAPMSSGAGTTTYSSSAPAIAEVSNSGLLTAAAPGTTVITATFTVGGITRAASMDATVHEGPDEYPRIAGVYDLTAVVTAWDFAGSPKGLRETAVLTIQHSRDTHLFTGTYANLRWFYPSGDTSGPLAGSLSGSVDCLGRIVIELGAEGGYSFWDGQGTLTSRQIVGDFFETVWEDAGYAGTFTAERRQAE